MHQLHKFAFLSLMGLVVFEVPLSSTVTTFHQTNANSKIERHCRERRGHCRQREHSRDDAVLNDTSINRSNNTGGRAWCVLDKENTKHFRHFPHTLQSLAPCWNYFCMAREEDPTLGCGIFLNSSALQWEHVSSWSKSLVQAMNCSVVTMEPHPDDFREFRKPRLHGFFRRMEDVKLLQDLVLASAISPIQRQRHSSAINATIGIVQRIKKRVTGNNQRMILNLAKIQRALQRSFPTALLQVTNLEGFTMPQQAAWFNRQDVVVIAHGAAVTNSMFMAEHSAVIEIFPDDYHVYMFKALMRSCRVVPYEIYNNETSANKHPKHPRDVDLLPNAALVVELVGKALAKQQGQLTGGGN